MSIPNKSRSEPGYAPRIGIGHKEVVVKSDFKVLGQTRFCCLQGSNPNVARDTLSKYGDQSCEIVVKSDFKSQSYGPDTILLLGYAVTLTFKVATQMLHKTRRFNMVIIFVKYFQNPTSNNKVMGRT